MFATLGRRLVDGQRISRGGEEVVVAIVGVGVLLFIRVRHLLGRLPGPVDLEVGRDALLLGLLQLGLATLALLGRAAEVVVDTVAESVAGQHLLHRGRAPAQRRRRRLRVRLLALRTGLLVTRPFTRSVEDPEVLGFALVLHRCRR